MEGTFNLTVLYEEAQILLALILELELNLHNTLLLFSVALLYVSVLLKGIVLLLYLYSKLRSKARVTFALHVSTIEVPVVQCNCWNGHCDDLTNSFVTRCFNSEEEGSAWLHSCVLSKEKGFIQQHAV